MGKLINLVGQKFNKLTVIERDYSQNKRPYWLCKCDCGNIVSVRGDLLRSGNTKACGCLYKKHGQATHTNRSRLYNIYHGMKKRCYNKKCNDYKYYGGRGIKICDEWLLPNGFIRFYNWAVNNGYSDSPTIDRVDVNGNYEPSNCRWVDMKTQLKNRRKYA